MFLFNLAKTKCIVVVYADISLPLLAITLDRFISSFMCSTHVQLERSRGMETQSQGNEILTVTVFENQICTRVVHVWHFYC